VIQLGSRSFELAYENKNGWNFEAFRDRYSDVLDRYDYIVGDWGYNQLRLKGFFREGNPKGSKESCITSLQDYIQEYCNFGCAYFVLERIPNKKKTIDQALGGQDEHKDGQPKQQLKEQSHKDQEQKERHREDHKERHKERHKEHHHEAHKETNKDKDSQKDHKEHHKDQPKHQHKEQHKEHHKNRNGRQDESRAMKQHPPKDQKKHNKRPHRGENNRQDRKKDNRQPEAVRTSQE